MKTVVQIGGEPDWLVGKNSKVSTGRRRPAVARRGRVVEFARGCVDLAPGPRAHGYMACCMSTTPAPDETPIHDLEVALGLSRLNFFCLFWQLLACCFWCAPITAEGGRTIGIGTITFDCEVHHAQPLVRPGHDMMACTATFLILLINDH